MLSLEIKTQALLRSQGSRVTRGDEKGWGNEQERGYRDYQGKPSTFEKENYISGYKCMLMDEDHQIDTSKSARPFDFAHSGWIQKA